MAYVVKVIQVGCCESDLDPKKVEQIANEMDKQGYSLHKLYVDSTTMCCSSKKSVVLIFKKNS
jgi:hypothetical protein